MSAPPAPRKDASDKHGIPPTQPPRPLGLFGCTHGELYVPPLAPPPTTKQPTDAAYAAASAAVAQASLPRPSSSSLSRSYATLASRMRAMGWKVDLLVDFDRQLIPPKASKTTPTTSTTIVVLASPTRPRFSRKELDALRRFLLERGGRLWLLAEGADPAADPDSAYLDTTNLWRRLAAPLLGVTPRTGECVVRLSATAAAAAPPLLARAAAAALEVAAEAEEEEDEGEGGGKDQDDGGALSLRRASAALRRVRRAAATASLCLHPRHALVAGGPLGLGAEKAGGGASPVVLNRSVARAFMDPADDEEEGKRGGKEHEAAFVFADGCPLDVFFSGGAGAATEGAATPLLSSGRQCYPADRPLMAAWEQQQQGGGRALVFGSAAMFSDAWIGGGGGSSNGNGNSTSSNRCEGNRRLSDWCLRWLSAPPLAPEHPLAAALQLDAADGAAARAAMGVARSTGARPPHALLPAVGALTSRVGTGGGNGFSGLPAVSLPPVGCLRGGGGDWRAMLDRHAFDGGSELEGEKEDGAGGEAAAVAALLRPLA